MAPASQSPCSRLWEQPAARASLWRRPSGAARGRTCAQQVLQGVRVLQQAAGVQPGLQAVAVAVITLRVIIKFLQAAVATEVDAKGLPVSRGAIRIVDPRFREVL